ncbi:MAG: T9SS type A sorting domain-containing protein [Lewinellaceae bacterium]|nr:T9SS type A sorting domain-containing protein [Saprospiraceae bacterium]MCB9340714.1 T9SS type A sorting domain-containing protein [Lewinellaceae bacterium]
MLTTNFTKMPLWIWAFAPIVLLLFGHSSASAQTMVCNDDVQVSVDITPNLCQAIVYADMILESNLIPGHDYSIVIKKGLTIIATGTNQVTITDASQHFGYNLVATIGDLTTGNSCWGTMHIEDKLPPVITCADITVSCAANLNAVAAPSAVDNCDLNPEVSLTNEVVNANSICSNGYATVTRTYVAVDNWSNVSQPCTQTIYLQRPTAVDFPNDIIWSCEQYSAYPNIVAATALHPYITDSKPATGLIIDVNLNPDCDDNDLPNNDNPNINSTNVANGGLGCPGSGLDDADVLELTGSGIVANVQGEYCKYVTSKSDQTLQTCGNLFKIIRTWTVLDWCTGSIVTTGVGGEDNVQVIKILDEVKPFIERPPFSVNANLQGVGSQGCKSQDFLLAPTVLSDNCSGVTVKIITPVGEAIYLTGGNGNNGGLIPAPGLPLGVHNITYQANDGCGNQTTLIVPVTVVDNTAPVTVCDEITDVNLSTDGRATVFAQTFDDGSYDNCCLDHFEVRRMEDPCADGHDDTVFGPSVVFCCEDAGDTVMVVFRAVDCYGNSNTCMVQVIVNDKIAPTQVVCPPNKRITCDWYADNLEIQLANLAPDQVAQNEYLDQYYGTATFYDNCGYELTRTLNINVDQCLEGVITRTFKATDPSGNQSSGNGCTQQIFVDHVSDWVVEFPADITVNCGTTVPDFGDPKIFFETCELVAISYDDVVYTVVPDACYKIVRKWTIINWCVVGGNIDQEVIEMPENQLGLPFPQCDLDGDGDCDSRTFRDSWNATLRPSANIANQTTGPDTDLDSDPWDGFIVYDQVIKVLDQVDPVFNGCQVPDVCITGNTCSTALQLPVPDIDECSPFYNIKAEIKFGSTWQNAGTVQIESGVPVNEFTVIASVGPGTYQVRYTAKDNCNNQTACETSVTVRDCKKPTPYCKSGLIIELMDVMPAMVQTWASDFNAGSFDNCPGALKYSFSSNTADSGRVFTCADLGIQPVEMWVTDNTGNKDFCITQVEIQANLNQCGDDTLLVHHVGGTIANEDNQSVENVNVDLSGPVTSASVLTNSAGNFNFSNIPNGLDLTVSPTKNDDPINGVTTFDLVLISKHILGMQPLSSPYKIIAADANHSNTVTTLDLVVLRKLILQIITELPNNTSWRFVKKNYVFPSPTDPWSDVFPETNNINNIASNILNSDFVAIKVGDVNGSAVNQLSAGNEDRSAKGTFNVKTDNQSVQTGEIVNVSFEADDITLLGYQFTLNFDKSALELLDVVPGIASEENFGFTNVDKGAITSSWNGEANTAKAQLFSIEFRALKNGKLSDFISLNSRFTKAEAYSQKGDLLDVQLSFNGKMANGFDLYQNTPNPFKGQTAIGFNLAEGGRAKLTLTDISGKVLNVIEQEFTKGYNEITLNSDKLPVHGVIYYTLETSTNTATRKMIVIE